MQHKFRCVNLIGKKIREHGKVIRTRPTYVIVKAKGTLAHETLTQQVSSFDPYETNECIFTMLQSLRM